MTTAIRNRKTILLTAIFCLFLGCLQISQANEQNPGLLQAELLQQQVAYYTEIQQKGGWQKITLAKKKYVKGESAPAIRQLKNRLKASGEFTANDTTSLFTAELETAITKLQRRYGFPQNGVVDADFVKALNVPVEQRLEQLQINLQRMQIASPASGGKQIIVNIPEYKLHVYENGSHVFDMNVVVGKTSSKTAIFDDELTHVVFSPYWNVPSSIVRNEILPAARKKRNYLARNGYEKTGVENGLPVIRQKPGPSNSLGLVKFLFPNEHNIYFHDTPAKTLFSNRTRANSHGCVRLAEPAKLAEYLLQESPQWSPLKISDAMHAGKEQWVKLDVPVPVSIMYLTAWIDHNGELNFRDDIYGLDKGGAVAALAK